MIFAFNLFAKTSVKEISHYYGPSSEERMPQRTVYFTIRPNGQVEERVEGLLGEGCKQLTERLETALGTVVKTQPTSEAFLSEHFVSQPLAVKLS